jgi:hypothetical protein
MVLYMNPLLFSSANQRRTTQGSAMLPLSLRPSPCICICKANDVEGLSISDLDILFLCKNHQGQKDLLGHTQQKEPRRNKRREEKKNRHI